MKPSIALKQLKAKWISREDFAPYGQLITASEDGKTFDHTDAQLNLNQGIPRFYIMRLEHRGRKFGKITRHQLCTQCLGSLEGKDWLMAVAPPSTNAEPDLNSLQAFRIPRNCFIKLEVGTWHAGPYFEEQVIDFYNLELSNTNVVDHFTYDFTSKRGLEFEIVI